MFKIKSLKYSFKNSLQKSFFKSSKNFSFLTANIPSIEVYIRKEYLTQFQSGKGEYESGIWVSVKSKTSRALLFETLIYEYGALYDKLPISAFVWKKDADVSKFLPLEYLQLWNCLSYEATVINKSLLEKCTVNVLMKNGKFYKGTYLFTVDNCHSDRNSLDSGFSEVPTEHKSFNIIKLDNGQFCAQPNNRIFWEHSSLVPVVKKKPYFKVCSEDYMVETEPKWSVSDSNDFMYKSKEEEKIAKDDDIKKIEEIKNLILEKEKINH
jgi:hypothetical protein